MIWKAPESSFVITNIWRFCLHILSQVISCCTLDVTYYIFVCITCPVLKAILSGDCSYTAAIFNVMQVRFVVTLYS